MKCSVESKSHIAHQLVNCISCHLCELDFIRHIVFYLLPSYLCFCWSIQSLLRKLHFWSEWILLNSFIYSLLVYLFLFLFILSILYFFLNLFYFYVLPLSNFWYIISYSSSFLLFLFLPFQLLLLCLFFLFILLNLFDLFSSFP